MENTKVGHQEIDSIYCKRCHRKLKDENSIKLGYGKTCYKKINKRNALYLFEIEVINTNEIIDK